MPLLFLVFLGYGFEDAALPGLSEDIDYIQYLVPGIVGFTMMFGASFAGLSILSDRDVGFLKEILVAPISRTSIVLGRIAGGSTTAFLQGILILVFSVPLGFRFASVFSLPLAFGFLVLIAVTFVGFGIALASQFRDSEGFMLIVQFIIFAVFPLGSAVPNRRTARPRAVSRLREPADVWRRRASRRTDSGVDVPCRAQRRAPVTLVDCDGRPRRVPL